MPVSEDRAKELYDICANHPGLPSRIEFFCPIKSFLAMGLMLQNGTSIDDVGQIMIWAPPAFLYDNPADRPLMSCRANFIPDLAVGEAIVVDDYLFRAREVGGGKWAEILNKDGGPINKTSGINPLEIYRSNFSYGQNMNELWCWYNHIAPTVTTRTSEGTTLRIVDTGTEGATPQAWKDAQNCPQTVLLHAGRDNILRLLPEQDEGGRQTIQAIARYLKISAPDPYGRDQGAIVKALIGQYQLWNFYNPPFVRDEKGQPSLDQTVAYHAAILKPMVVFQNYFSNNIHSTNHNPRDAMRPGGQPVAVGAVL